MNRTVYRVEMDPDGRPRTVRERVQLTPEQAATLSPRPSRRQRSPLLSPGARPYVAGLDEDRRPVLSVRGRVLGYRPDGVPIVPIFGAEGGYSTEADVINEGRLAGADQANLLAMYSDFQETLRLYREGYAGLRGLFTYSTGFAAEMVVQRPGDAQPFEIATEFGVPRSSSAAFAESWFAFLYNDYDRATRYTWKYLRDADPRQVEALHDQVFHDDDKMCIDEVLAALFGLRTGVNEHGRAVLALYNNDGMIPPNRPYTDFSGPHSHYLTSGSTTVDGADLRDLRDTIKHHGYPRLGGRLVLLVHPELMEQVAAIRAGDVPGNPYDFIISPNAPARYNVDGDVIGELAPTTWNDLPVAGQWGDVLVIEHEYMPPDYLVMVASSGPGSMYNPVAFREHANPAYRGLRLIPGSNLAYPLVESFYSRGFGVGVRHRGAAAVMQLTTSAEYQPPSRFA